MSELADMDEQEINVIPKRGGKRKAIIIDKTIGTQEEDVEPLHVQDLVLTSGHFKAHIVRLKYFACPHVNKRGGLDPKVEYIDMDREWFVRSMYRLFKPNFNRTKKGYAESIIRYVRWLDENKLSPIDKDYFHPKLIAGYMAYWGGLVAKGKSKGMWTVEKTGLSFVLRELNRSAEARNLPSIKGAQKEAIKTAGLDVVIELKPLVKAYFRAFSEFEKCFKTGVAPTIHPIWDEQLFEQQALLHNWTKMIKSRNRTKFVLSVFSSGRDSGRWLNQFSRMAIMITFMFTGQNTTPILKLQHSDVVFDSKQAGKVYFNMEKARAKYLSFDTSIGFSPFARRFIESWLAISIEMQKYSNTSWLFPFLRPDGTVNNFISSTGIKPQASINGLTRYLGLPHATARIFRQTKIDTLMKVTEDIYLVSMSANNEVGTLQARYSHGLAQDHERNLCASTAAMFQLAKGSKVDDAVAGAKYAFHDILSEYDYHRLRNSKQNTHEAQTPLGVRCMDNTKGSAQYIKNAIKKSGIAVEDNESLCTDFLECFECSYHKLVAAVEDIWLMLSFRDTLTEMEQYPTVNSLPQGRYQKLCQTIDCILKRFNEVSADNYTQALEKHKYSSHPLYASLVSLNDLLEVFS